MARVDFTPLFRSTVGFDRLWDMLDHATQVDDAQLAYPPYDIVRTGEHEYRIVMAVAGFGKDDVEITAEANTLTVRGRGKEQGELTFLHRGIARRAFERRFQLAEHIRVTDAALADGLLTIELAREIPEALKPRKIEIVAGQQPQALGTQDDARKLAA